VASSKISKPVKVLAHERKRPARRVPSPPSDLMADNAFMPVPEMQNDNAAITGGLVGEPKVNHLKAAVGLLNRRR
jgi:hypothetical protein